LARVNRAAFGPTLSVEAPGEETIRQSVFDFVCVGNGIYVIKPNDAIKIVNAGDAR
jgi:hypothetical protein